MLKEALRKTFVDPEFGPYFKKIVSDDISPLGAEELTRVVTEMPRDRETLALLKKFSGPEPLAPR